MSYILEALKKAEHQREIGQVPRIDSEHESAAAGLSSRWVVIVVLVLLINAGLLLVLFWPDGTTGVSGPVAVSPNGLSGVTQSPLPGASRADRPGIVTEPVTGTSLPRRRENTPANRTAPVPPTVPSAVTPPPVQVAPPPIAPIQPPLRPAPASTPVPVQQARSLPVWPQVSTQIFQQLRGGLRLDVHVYSDQPQDRFVLINLQKYHEGEQLQEGPVVAEITAEGVVLSLQGQQFLVRAQ